jgi:hypothetical protein
MSKINLYCISKNGSFEGDFTQYYFRKNDILICGQYEDDIISLNYDLVRNKLSDEEKDFISNAHCYSFEEEEEYSKEIINYKNNDKLEIIEEVNIKNYNNASSSEIEVNKTIFKVNEKHLLIIDQGDIHTMTTITNVFTLN